MNWLSQILTGANNTTLAIGRVIGSVVALIFLILFPIGVAITLERHLVGADDWGTIFDKLTVFVPAICLAVAGLIGLTAHSEPRQGDHE